MNIIQKRSPNQGPAMIDIRYIVIHSSIGTFASARDWLTNKVSRVSAHYLIARTASSPNSNADIVQMVPDNQQAWHAGESMWNGRHYLNPYAVGIELANTNDWNKTTNQPIIKQDYTEIQIGACIELCNMLCRNNDIIPNATYIVSHQDIAKGRKFDPIGLDMNMLRKRVWDLYHS